MSGALIAGGWAAVKASPGLRKLIGGGLAIVAVAAIGGGLYACGERDGNTKAVEKSATKELEKIGTARRGAEAVEKRIDDSDDKRLIECNRTGTC